MRRKSVLALGSNTKNTVCFLSGDKALISPVHQNLYDPRDFLAFERTVKQFLKKKPATIAYDLHPEYASSKYALDLRPTAYDLRPIQHHHAHIAACMAENGARNKKVIGVAYDGTGMGPDGHIWGAEFLVCDYKSFRRMGHLAEIPLLGFDQAIRQPWRLAAAWLYQVYGSAAFRLKTAARKRIDTRNWRLLQRMHAGGLDYPSASSMGRLFDAVGFLVMGKPAVRFEGELAVALEKLAARHRQPVSGYQFKISQPGPARIIQPDLMFRQILADLEAKRPGSEIARRFHWTVSQMTHDMCCLLRRATGIRRVALSGGVFQNKLLLSRVLDLLYKDDFEVLVHRKLSCNDSNISLGQAVIARH